MPRLQVACGNLLFLLLLGCGCWLPVHAASLATPFVVSLGAFECEFTRSHLDAIKWRDRYVIGDPFDNPRPTVCPVLMQANWRLLAQPSDDEASEPVVEQTETMVTVKLAGVAKEVGDGPGRWSWRQTWTLERTGRLRLAYTLTQTATPRGSWSMHRLELTGNRDELFITHPNKDKHTPGKPVPIRTRDGREVAPLFGGDGNIIKNPAEIRLPYAGHQVVLRPDSQTRSVELWNGWWRQKINLSLPSGKQVEAQFEFDLTDLPNLVKPRLAVASLPREQEPWRTAKLPPLARPARVLRFAQQTPGIIASSKVTPRSEEELERFFTAMAPHFDVMELVIAWTDWKWDLGWANGSASRLHAEAIAAEVRKQLRIAHRHGIRLALSLNFGDSGPGTGQLETRRQPQYQGETLDPETGSFIKKRDVFDWSSAEATARARQAWEDCARLIGPVDYLFFNEPHWRLSTWYQSPLFSEAALADFRRFTGNPTARFPAKAYVPPTLRTDNQASPADWGRWYDWAQASFARMIATQAGAFAKANTSNPDYAGAIYFQNVGWTGPQYAVDLDRLAALPEVTWLCAEYVTDANSPQWLKFRYYAARHDRRLSSFVNIGQYDPDAPGRVRYEGTDEGFASAVRMGIEEHAPMITLYPMDALDPKSPGYNPKRTAIWDRLTRAPAP
ncbi:MAG: hypothetical protein WCO56_12155 [Verrucomicrobiota bacterium]